MAQNRQAEKDMSETGHETTRRAAGHAAQTARTMTDAAERTARTGADVLQRNSEQVRQTFEMGSDAAARMALNVETSRRPKVGVRSIGIRTPCSAAA